MPFLAQVETECYDHLHKDTSYPTKYWTMGELFRFATYTGAIALWTREQIDLAAFSGFANVLVRFRLVSDGTVVQDGWYIDDVVVTVP